MLKYFYPKLHNSIFQTIIQKILDSKFLILLIGFLALLSNLFSLEIIVLYIYLVIIIIGVLFSDDLLCLLPIACCGYYTFSRKNNPLAIDKTSVFLEESVIIHLIIIFSITAVFAITRLVFEIITKEEKRKLPKLTWGFLALGFSYILGGLLTKYYDGRTAFFGLVQILSLSFCYFFFYFTIDFKKVKKTYFAFLVTVISLILLFEVLGMLYYAGFFASNGNFSRSLLYTGWGINNNVAACICMSLPAPFYYVTTKRQGWLYLIFCNILLITLISVQSRNGILFGILIFLICFIASIIKSSNFNRINLILTQIFFLVIYALIILEFNELLIQKFSSIISAGLNDSGRFKIYIDGLKQFLNNPIFGNGFYECLAGRWGNTEIGDFLPSRYHNTYVQILASCGIFSLAAYIFHRIQTIKLITKNFSVEKFFMFMILFGLIITSILDCHFFNFGPGFLYSTILLLLEINCLRKENFK